MKRRRFDQRKVVDLYRVHRTVVAVARLLRTGVKQIKRELAEAKIEVKLSSIVDAKRDDIIEDYRSDTMSYAAIGRKHGFSADAIKDALVRWEIYDSKRPRYVNRKSPYECWILGHGKEEADKRMARMAANISQKAQGAGNSMYGKPSARRSGNGWSGSYRGSHFRSLREAMFMIKMDEEGVSWRPGEKGHSIPYRFMDRDRTYRPDFIVGNVMYELKPTRLHDTPSVTAKRIAAEAFCLVRDMEYRLIDIEIDEDVLKAALDKGDIRFERDYERKFRAYVN